MVHSFIEWQNVKKLPNINPILQITTLNKKFCKKLPYIIQFFAKDYLVTDFGV